MTDLVDASLMPMAQAKRVYCLVLGHEYVRRRISLAGGDDEILREPIPAMLVATEDGWVLLETGLSAVLREDPGHFDDRYPVGRPELAGGADPLLEGLAACGVSVEDVTAVAVSHLHLDHSGGLRHFAGRVPVFIQRAELDYARSAAGAADRGYVQEDFSLERIDWRLLDGDAEIAPGISAISTPGHTPGHMSYRVELPTSGTWIFAVDAIDLAEGIELDREIGSAARPQDVPLLRSSHERLTKLAQLGGFGGAGGRGGRDETGKTRTHLIPGHCPVTWPELPVPPGHLA